MSEDRATLYILVEIAAGSHIGEAARAMAALAARLDCPVQGQFNDTPMWARPGETPAKVLDTYNLVSNISKEA